MIVMIKVYSFENEKMESNKDSFFDNREEMELQNHTSRV